MTDNPHQFTGRRFALRLAGFYAAFFLTIGVQVPFLPVWFAAKGLDPRMIGVGLALPMVVRIFAIPVATRIADRRDALRAVIMLTSAAAVAGYAALALAEGTGPILVAFAVASAAYTPVMLLADAYALRGLGAQARRYGRVRLWGSAAFIVASFAAGSLLDLLAPRDLIWLVVAAMAVAAVMAAALAPLGGHGGGGAAAGAAAVAQRAPLLRDPAFLAVAAAASLIQASHAFYYGFSTIAWRSHGFDGLAIAALWAFGVVGEITLFALSSRLPASLNPVALIALGAAGATVRWAVMALDPPAVLLPLLQGLHGLSFGATHLGTISFAALAAPPGRAATAQGYLAVALGAVMAAAMATTGELYAHLGDAGYGAMAFLALAGGAFAGLASRLARSRPQ